MSSQNKLIKIAIFLLAAHASLLTAGCGFEPVYGVHKGAPVGVESKLAEVEISNIPDREGQYLRNALIDRFYRQGRPLNPQYDLEVTRLQERLVKMDITKTADATRGQLRMLARMTLRDRGTRAVLVERDLRTITSYNILGSEFATRVTEDSARQNALDDLARQVELQLNLYFKR